MSPFVPQDDPGAVAIIDADQGTEITYGELLDKVRHAADGLRREIGRGLVFHLATDTVDSIVAYLACLEAQCPVALLEPGPRDRTEPLLRAYDPDAVLLPEGADTPTSTYRIEVRKTDRAKRLLHPKLALLLTTSGSTGSPKLVRLTLENMLANARSIVGYLGIQPGERSIQGLPMHYSYGLSLVNSHLAAGATVVLTRHSFMRPEFWEAFDRTACTSFAGVPHMYETLHRLRFDPKRHPRLRTMTQAGGGLRHDLIRSFHERTSAAQCRFFVMYGQTEAAPRIAYVPHQRLGEKIGSIGIPIPDGRLSLAPLEDSDREELIYHGPNVMMGYAESAEDLAAGDSLKGTLHTGDLATADPDGYYYLAGRLKRFAKLFGRRISLEDVEKELELRYPIQAAATDREERLLIYAAARENVDLQAISRFLAQRLNVPAQHIRVEAVAEIPLTARGKKDYKALAS